MNKRVDEAFLMRWLNDELTDSELKDFRSSSEYLLYSRIMSTSEEFSIPEFRSEKVHEKLNKQINISNKKAKVVRFRTKYIAVAASIAIILGLWLFVNKSTTSYKTNYGEQLSVMLPDSSEVLLNSKSFIKFDKKKWSQKREVLLKGEAYFKVRKGKKFKVITDLGSVAVIGTQFDVHSSNDYIEVKCFEGKVNVTSGKDQNILNRGNASRSFKTGVTEKWTITAQEPGWKNGESSFKSIALKYVIDSMKNQFGVTFKVENINLEQKFTGSYTHDDLKIALKTVFEPMKIAVTFADENTVILRKQ
ncbi:FecR family protein [Tenacibaculum sp. C7A-26P2]|uniref:FecR family protein n=1 Tax=Tenacibaculum sp. C7A-26P2 TaxID=3447504 RepID=UPI003F85D1E6